MHFPSLRPWYMLYIKIHIYIYIYICRWRAGFLFFSSCPFLLPPFYSLVSLIAIIYSKSSSLLPLHLLLQLMFMLLFHWVLVSVLFGITWRWREEEETRLMKRLVSTLFWFSVWFLFVSWVVMGISASGCLDSEDCFLNAFSVLFIQVLMWVS